MPLNFTMPCLGKIIETPTTREAEHLHDLSTHQEVHKIAKSFISAVCSFSIDKELPLELKNTILNKLFTTLKIKPPAEFPPLSTEEIIELFLQLFTHESISIQGHIFEHLVEQMTPQAFLSDFTFERTKHFFYRNTPDDESYYKNPENLTRLGLLRKYTELKNSDNIYFELINEYHEFIKKDYQTKKDLYKLQLRKVSKLAQRDQVEEDSDMQHAENNYKLALNAYRKKNFISFDVFLAIRRYSTNFYRIINGELRFNQQNNCLKYIELINEGLIRLCTIPLYQLKESEHQLTRYINLPSDILNNLIDDIHKQTTENAVAIFKDKALLSTSYNNGGAAEFAKNANLVVHIFTNGDNMLGIKLRKISVFPNEGEFLYLPGVEFRVKKIEYKQELKCWHIDIQATTMQYEIHRTLNVMRCFKLWRKKTAECKAKASELCAHERKDGQDKDSANITTALKKAEDRAKNPPSFAEVLPWQQQHTASLHQLSTSSLSSPENISPIAAKAMAPVSIAACSTTTDGTSLRRSLQQTQTRRASHSSGVSRYHTISKPMHYQYVFDCAPATPGSEVAPQQLPHEPEVKQEILPKVVNRRWSVVGLHTPQSAIKQDTCIKTKLIDDKLPLLTMRGWVK